MLRLLYFSLTVSLNYYPMKTNPFVTATSQSTSTSLSPTRTTIQAEDLSFQKIIAGLEPLYSRLSNLDLIKQVTFYSGANASSLIASDLTDVDHPYLMFGSITITTAGGADPNLPTLTLLSLTEEGKFIRQPFIGTQLPALQVAKSYIRAAIIDKFQMNAANIGSSFSVTGVIISLTRPITDVLDLSPIALPYIIVEDKAITSPAPLMGLIHYWPTTEVPFNLPTEWKVRFSAMVAQNVVPFQWTDYAGGISCYAFAGTVLPRNFYNFLQAAYQKAYAAPPINPAPPPTSINSHSLGQCITCIIYAVRAGIIRLGDDPKSFILPVVKFQNYTSYLSTDVTPRGYISSLFDWDPVDLESVTLWSVTEGSNPISNGTSIIPLFFPIPPNGANPISIPYQLMEASLPKISYSIPATTTVTPNSDPDYAFNLGFDIANAPKHTIGEYAFSFNYPVAPL